jgi:threonine dehydrogenase-like Zn-dependent dehydrogenase
MKTGRGQWGEVSAIKRKEKEVGELVTAIVILCSRSCGACKNGDATTRQTTNSAALQQLS